MKTYRNLLTMALKVAMSASRIMLVSTLLFVASCTPKPKKVFSDREYPIGTVVYVLPDSLMAVACGGDFGGYLDTTIYLNIQYVTNLGEVEEQAIHKKLIYK